MDKLYSYWASAYLESESLEFIESRMIEVLDFPLNKFLNGFGNMLKIMEDSLLSWKNSLKKKATRGL